MRKLLVSLSLLLSAPACARPAPPPPPAAARDADPALWVVRDADTTVYLFGTVHALRPGTTWFDDAVKAAFDGSDELVLEVVMPDAQTMGALVAAAGFNPSGPPLSAQLKPAERDALARATADLNVSMAEADRMDPWLLSTRLTLLRLIRDGFDPGGGPETVLADAAAKSAKPVRGLETVAQQLGYFDGLSVPAQRRLLDETVRDLPRAGTELDRMVRLWAAGNPDGLGRAMNKELRSTPEVARVLLYDRNERWADWIKARMERPGTVFVAVGAGHLAGRGDVQQRLAARGLKVVRVRY